MSTLIKIINQYRLKCTNNEAYKTLVALVFFIWPISTVSAAPWDKLVEQVGEIASQAIQGKQNENQNNSRDQSPDAEISNGRLNGNQGTRPQITNASEFESGSKVLFQSRFDNGGSTDFRGNWNTNGSGQIVSVDSYPGRWLALAEDSSYKLRNFINYPQKFTIEFDLLAIGGASADISNIGFGFQRDNVLRGHIRSSNTAGISLNYASNKVYIYSSNGRDSKSRYDFVNGFNRPYHVAITVTGVWMDVLIDGVKVAGSDVFAESEQKHLYISGPNRYRNQGRVLIKNIRIAGF